MKKYLNYIHPLLFSIYPVLFLYSQNIHEYTEGSIIVPLIFSLIFGAVIFLTTKLIFKDIAKSAIISSFIIFVTLSFGRLIGILGISTQKIGSVSVDKQLIFLVIFLIVLYLIIRGVNKFKNALTKVNQFLVLLSALLIIFALIPIITFEAKTGRILKSESKEVVKDNKPAVTSDTPDIYYFIFDRYAGPKSQSEEFGIKDDSLFKYLTEKGFYTAAESTTNYPKTFMSLTTSLNMEYLDFLTQQTAGGASPDESIATPYLRNNKVINYLDDRGYTIVNIGPKSWNPTSKNPYADVNFQMSSGTYPLVDAFGTGFLNMTIAEPLFKIAFRNPVDVSSDPDNNEHRKIALFEIDAVEKAIKIPSPKFVFIHILLPHDPFVFDENCNPISEEVVKKHGHIYNYDKQLKCTNKVIIKLLNQVFEGSKNPPIIILQSDEGPFPMKNPVSSKQDWASANDGALREKFPILNAYFFPNQKYDSLYQSITPVNSFRVLFNEYFGENHPLLEDKNYVFKDEDNFYIFTDVTDRIK